MRHELKQKSGFRGQVLALVLCFGTLLTTPARADNLKTHFSPTAKKPFVERPYIRDKWALLVGISNFQDRTLMPVRFASKNVQDLSEVFTNPQIGRFAPDHVLILTDTRATKSGIEDAFNNWIFKVALPSDLIIVYFCSRTMPTKTGNGFLLCTYDTLASEADLSAIHLKDLLVSAKRRLQSEYIVCLLDLDPVVDAPLASSLARSADQTLGCGAHVALPCSYPCSLTPSPAVPSAPPLINSPAADCSSQSLRCSSNTTEPSLASSLARSADQTLGYSAHVALPRSYSYPRSLTPSPAETNKVNLITSSLDQFSSSGITIFSATNLTEPSQKDQSFRSSLFTHYLIEGIKANLGSLSLVSQYVKTCMGENLSKNSHTVQNPCLVLPSMNPAIANLVLNMETKRAAALKTVIVGHPIDQLALSRPDIVLPRFSSLARSAVNTTEMFSPATTNNQTRAKFSLLSTKGSKDAEEEENIDPKVEFGPYMAKMKQAIQSCWHPPRQLQNRRVVVTFTIKRDGTIANPLIIESSGLDELDQSALTALIAASPLEPLPSGAPKSVDIRYVFDWRLTKEKNEAVPKQE